MFSCHHRKLFFLFLSFLRISSLFTFYFVINVTVVVVVVVVVLVVVVAVSGRRGKHIRYKTTPSHTPFHLLLALLFSFPFLLPSCVCVCGPFYLFFFPSPSPPHPPPLLFILGTESIRSAVHSPFAVASKTKTSS